MADIIELQALYRDRRYDELAPLARERLASGASLPAGERAQLFDVLAAALYEARRYREAAEARAEQLAFHQETGTDQQQVARVQTLYAWALLGAGDPASALPFAARGYLARHDQLGAEHELTLATLELNIQLLNELGRYPEMAALAGDLVAARRRTLAADDPRLLTAKKWQQSAARHTQFETGTTSGTLPKPSPVVTSTLPASSTAFSRSLDVLSAVTSGVARGVIEGLLG
ncbi:hypothetical protein EHW97_15105 [Aeromicrobium camelliae]|uniref:Tetratricopeptide repeat protein n=1 Tax=Aeromicrobium camelliae TaxID=1538144 RepID=A0A3N6W2A4_9ACTN|nr:hypothetical protein [Aeromicrobium camelliae]RQN01656.1 hypothetical protein EHW97_15105 [Aeromicrobium camelliae]